MNLEKYMKNIVSCDVCGSNNAVEIECLLSYTNNQKIFTCKDCGFVYVRERRSASEIAEEWSKNIFVNNSQKHYYTTKIPALKARQVFVADFIDSEVGLNNKYLCDVGAGEGEFLKIVENDYKAKVFGIEPSKTLCEELTNSNINNFCGAIEEIKTKPNYKKKFDIVTIMWTLEASSDPNEMLKISYELLKDDGLIVIATGSRILVPFKKPLYNYVNNSPVDTHPTRFTKNTLSLILKKHGFKVSSVNKYIDQDWLCIIAKKGKENKKIQGDNYLEVIDFFERWHVESQRYKKKGN